MNQKNDKRIKHPELIPLIEEYLTEERGRVKLKQIVEYLEEKFREMDKKISDTGNTALDKRNKSDMVRRALDKMSTVKSTKGKTSNKRYYYSEEIVINDMIRVFFLFNELHGGYTELNRGWVPEYLNLLAEKNSLPKPQTEEEYREVASLYPQGSVSSILPKNIPDITDKLLSDRDNLFLLITLIQLNTHFRERDNTVGELPFDSHNTLTGLKNRSEKWFENNLEWMESEYFAFKGPDGINFLIDNIKENMMETDLSKPPLNISEEINFLVRKKKLKNKDIFTLALLHLNRSLLEDPRE